MTPVRRPRSGGLRGGARRPKEAEAAPQANPITPRERAVAAAVEQWHASLNDLAGGSALWDLRTLGDAVVDLTSAHPSGIAQMYAGRTTRLSNLVREGSALSQARRRIRVVAARTEELAQRYGVAPTYVAMGVATWRTTLGVEDPADRVARGTGTGSGAPAGHVATEVATPGAAGTDSGTAVGAPGSDVTGSSTPGPVDTGPTSAGTEDATQPLDPDAGSEPALPERPEPRVVRAPVLLRPVRLNLHGTDSQIDLELDPSVEVNSVLLRDLRAHGVDLDPAEIAASTMRTHGFSPEAALDTLAAAGAVLPEFQLDRRIVLGAFVHPGQALADDLDAQGEHLARHDVVAALAGDDASRERAMAEPPERVTGDRDPADDVGIGDLDSGQQQVLDTVATGQHLLIDAPPGVDVPTTVAAVLAQAAAQGKRVMYVPGTRRAAQGVLDRMRTLGVGDLALDLCGDTTWRRSAVQHLVDGLNPAEPEVDADQLAADRADLVASRATLAEFVTALHTTREPWQASAYDALQELAGLTAQRPGPRTMVRLDGDAVGMDARARESAREELARAAALGAFRLRAADTPWFGASLTSAAHAIATLDRVRELSGLLPTMIEQLEATAAQTGLDPAHTFTTWSEQLTLLEGIRSSQDVFTSQVFERSAADMAAATATRAWRSQHNIDMSWATRSRLRRQAKDLIRPGVSVGDLHDELVQVQLRREQWRKQCSSGGWPHLPEELGSSLRTRDQVAALLAELTPVLAPTMGGQDLHDVELTDLLVRLERLGADDATVRQMPERAAVLSVLNSMGLTPLVQDLTSRRVPTELVGAEFDLAWWSSVLEEMLATDPALAGLEATSLEGAATGMRRLERLHIDALAVPVRSALRRRVRETIAADRPHAQDFYRRAHQDMTDLKEAVSSFADLAWATRPVWLVPPMVVPAVLPPGQQADLLVFDAVQHLPTEHAISAIARADQVAIFGDTRRGGTGLVGSMRWLPTLTLSGDRVDQDPEIAAFLAEHGYSDVIHPVPAPPRSSPISLQWVDGTGMPAPDSDVVESVQAEVDAVVDLVIEHALTRPEESLAVVALNTRHADRVREAVLGTARGSSSLARFFDQSTTEAFSVVEVESAAGLRRDALIVTLGYGKTPHGRVLHRFGAVSGPDGAEYLVDVLDACRHRLTVVSCVAADDLDPDRLRSDGARMLRDLLQFAKDGSVPIRTEDADGHTPDRLLADLTDRLRRLGLRVVPRYGRPGGVRIPLAVGHPALPGELVLAVLTDDADYVAEQSLRRRDRHWVQRLENRGWQVQMVYSTAVFMDPQGEAERLAEQVNRIVAERRGEPLEQVRPVPQTLDDDGEDPLVTTNATLSAIRGEQIAGRMDAPTVTRAPIAGVRSQRPEVEPGRPLGDYGDDELDALLSWIASDDSQRTAAQLEIELRAELGLTRRGSHVSGVLGAAVNRSGLAVAEAEPGDTDPGDTDRGDTDRGDTDRGDTDRGEGETEDAGRTGPASSGTTPGGVEIEGAGEAGEREAGERETGSIEAVDSTDALDSTVSNDDDDSSSRAASKRAAGKGSEPAVPATAWEDDPRAWGDEPDGDDDRFLRDVPPHY